MKKTLIIKCYNLFFDRDVITIEMPVDRQKASTGYYSKMWRGAKKNIATHERTSKEYLNVTVTVRKVVTKNMTITTGGGVKLVMPSDFSKVDLKIVLLHLEAKILSLQ